MSGTNANDKPATGTSKLVRRWDPQAFGNSGVVLAFPATLLSIFGTNTSASPNANTPLYLMFFDSATLPANGTAPLFAPLALATSFTFDFNFNVGHGHGVLCGIDFATGIVWAVSTTAATLTVNTSNSVWLTGRYR